MSSDDEYDEAAARMRRAPAVAGRDDRELVRLAALAASSHNTQPWTFEVGPDSITIRPDLDRRCPVVDPDDAHLVRSLGCAAENMVQAAAGQGLDATVTVEPSRRSVTVGLRPGPDSGASPLADAILTRQCTRTSYEDRPVPSDQVALLERAGQVGRARTVLVQDPATLRRITDLVSRGNLAQLGDPAFRHELVSWIRFNPAAALRSADGLAGRATGQPSVPTWLGTALQRLLLRAGKQARVDAERLRSSAGVAVVVTPDDSTSDLVDAGRAYQRLALQAESLDIRTAFVNQPIEVEELRPRLATAIGLTDGRPQLAIRFGYGPKLPHSLRRPVDEVVSTTPSRGVL